MLLLVACWGQSQPESDDLGRWRALGDSVDSWEQARDAMESGDLEAARSALTHSIQRAPKQPVLRLWSAELYAKSGEFERALEELDRASTMRPDWPDERFRRATVLARLGKTTAAAELLSGLIQQGELTRSAIRQEPAFSQVIAEEPFVQLLRSPVRGLVRVPPGAVVVGEPFLVELQVERDENGEFSVEAPSAEGLGLERVEEAVDRRGGTGFRRRVSWIVVAHRPGRIRLGPYDVRVGDASLRIEGGSVDAIGRAEAEVQIMEWAVPSALFRDEAVPGQEATGPWVRLVAGDGKEALQGASKAVFSVDGAVQWRAIRLR